ncbi:MAG: nucleotide exchange factor GrpE [Chloroflexi bacterium]|nr:MAG: nucleotide exchange factor GrpE [Chloroflexota bacterium]
MFQPNSNRASAHRIPVRFQRESAPAPEPDTEIKPEQPAPEPAPAVDWEALAKRRQAEMENFRKRQARRADEAISAERERLLRLILPVADNLARALNQPDGSSDALRQGIELTRRELNRILAAEGVTAIESVGRPFDPQWHEALATAPGHPEPNIIIEEVEPGYRLGNKLLRPAKVIVSA